MRRKIGNILFSITAVAALFFMLSGQSMANIYATEDFQLTGKVEAKAAFFTNAAMSNSNSPYANNDGWKAGDMFKERNMLMLELYHDVSKLTGLDLQYRLVGRAIYDGVYDYGPAVFRQAYKDNKEEFDKYDIKYQYALWEAYANLKLGSANIRLGRQNVSWGNTDIIRVIDHINPIDNTWGGTGTESLDDRRIPLWMARVSYQSNNYIGAEAYFVPGAIDNTVAPLAPWGSPYGVPAPSLDPLIATGVNPGFNNSYGYLHAPDRDMTSSRAGLKILFPGVLGGDNSNLELSFQRTYWDSVAIRYVANPGTVIPFVIPGYLSIENEYPKVNIAGLSWNYVFPEPFNFIFKGDVAHVWGEPVYIPAINQPTGSFFGIPTFSTGQFTYKDFTNIGLSFERNTYIRFINPTEQVQFMFEYYGNYCHDWDDRMVVPIPDPENGENPSMERYEQIYALVVTSEYHAKLKISAATLYDPRGSWTFNPSITYKFNNPLTVILGYSASWGTWNSFGIGKDRDQVNITLKYEF